MASTTDRTASDHLKQPLASIMSTRFTATSATLAFIGLCALAQQPVFQTTGPGPPATASPAYLSGTVKVNGIPIPEDLIEIGEGQTYTVPQGKIFVLLSLGSKWAFDQFQGVTTELYADGVLEVQSNYSLIEVPRGFVAGPGSTLTVTGGAQNYQFDAHAVGVLATTEADPGQLRIAGIPAYQELVMIREGVPLVIPANGRFVLTGLGRASISNYGGFASTVSYFDGSGGLLGYGVTVEQNPATKLSVEAVAQEVSPEGAVQVDVWGGDPQDPSDARAWGYIAQQ